MKPTAPSVSSVTDTTIVYKLANGMTVLLREDHFAPVVALQVWVGAGGADEFDHEAGVAHVHEHMLFKGTQHRGVGVIAAEIESSGGQINAWTSWNETVYHIVVASQYAHTALDVLADAVRYSSFDPTELDKELAVVLEEWKRGEDSPSQKVFHALFESAFRVHPYRRPVIGTNESIQGLTRERILDFYRRFYTPNNMTLVVVGDVDAEETKRQIESMFGDCEHRAVDRPARAPEPPQEGLRHAALRMDVKEAQLALGFHVPSATHEDAPLLDLLAFVLGGGESSRLYRRLVAEDEITTSVHAFSYTPPDPGLFVVTASLEAEDMSKAYATIVEELARVRNDGVDVEELQRACTNLESDFVYRNETVQGQARELGYALTVYGDPDWDRLYLQALHGATTSDLQRIAQRYLTRDNLTVVGLAPRTATAELSHDDALASAAPLASGAELPAETARSRFTAHQRAVTEPRALGEHSIEPRLVRLENGVRIIIQEHRSVPVFSLRAAMLGGVITETKTDNGISNFVSEMLTRGTANRSREQIARETEALAGSLEGSSGYNSIGVSASFLSAHHDKAVALFLDALLEPAFSPVEVEKTRRELLLAIKNRDDNPARVAFNLTYDTVYGSHPYGMTTLGETTTVSVISADDLAAYYRRVLDPSRLVITVVGDIDTDGILARLSAAVGGLRASSSPFDMPPAPAVVNRVQYAERTIDRKQSHVVLAYQSVTVHDPDRYPLTVLENILSGQGGRLFFELRDRRSLAYSVSAFFTKGLAPGLFGGYIATDPANGTRAMQGLLDEFARVRAEPVKSSELERSQRHLVGSRAISLQTNGAKAEDMTLNELYGLGFRAGDDYEGKIAAVTAADVQRVAQRYLNPERRSEIVVGPLAETPSAAGS